MIGKTNVNERNTAYRVGAVDVSLATQATFLPADYDLDYFNQVNITSSFNNLIKEMCLGHSVYFTPEEMGNDFTSVPDYLFYKNQAVKEINIPSSVTNIGTYAFYDTGATTVRIDLPNVTSVGYSAFSNERSMTSAYINLPLVTNTNNLLNNASALQNLTLIAVQSMGDYFLYGASKLKNVTVPVGCLSMGTRCFDITAASVSSVEVLQLVLTRPAVVDGSGNYVSSPTTFSNNLMGARPASKVYIHCPMDSYLAYKRQLATTSDNGSLVSRLFGYLDTVVGDSLPSSVTQVAAGYRGTYNVAWYTDDKHTTAYAGATADQATRYYCVMTKVSETAI